MKKIMLSSIKKVLSENEMKHVTGGSGSGRCCQGGECCPEFTCSSDDTCIKAWGSGAYCMK